MANLPNQMPNAKEFFGDLGFPDWSNCLVVDSDGQSWFHYNYNFQLEQFHTQFFDCPKSPTFPTGNNVVVNHWVTREKMKGLFKMQAKEQGPLFDPRKPGQGYQIIPKEGWFVIYEEKGGVLTAKIERS